MKLSVISLNYNRLDFTKKHLQNLIDTTDIEFELIIVSNFDNKESGRVREYIRNESFCNNNVL